MGITGLLPALRYATKRIHISELANQVVAVDAYSWLHRGIYGACAVDLFHGRVNDQFVEYCLTRVAQLMRHGVKPLLVFDGGPLPMKKHREGLRAEERRKARTAAAEKLAAGDAKGATLHIQKACDVTPAMAERLIRELKKRSIPFVVAPYEADAQMAWLNRSGRAAAVITEDSDLLLFGCRRVLFKLDTEGYADEIVPERFLGSTSQFAVMKSQKGAGNGDWMDLRQFTHEQFRRICILSGCDYLPSVHGVGLRKAHQFMVRSNGNIVRALALIRLEMGDRRMASNYEDEFTRADLTFAHQRVFDLDQQRLEHLNPLEKLDELDNWDFLGPFLDNHVAVGIAHGLWCPVQKMPWNLIHSSTFISTATVIDIAVKKQDDGDSDEVLDSQVSLMTQKSVAESIDNASQETAAKSSQEEAADRVLGKSLSQPTLPFSLITERASMIYAASARRNRITMKRPISTISLNVSEEKASDLLKQSLAAYSCTIEKASSFADGPQYFSKENCNSSSTHLSSSANQNSDGKRQRTISSYFVKH